MMIKNYLLIAIILILIFNNEGLAQEENNKELANTYLELAEQIYQEQGAAIEIARDYFVQAADLDLSELQCLINE